MNIIDEIQEAWALAQQTVECNIILVPAEREDEIIIAASSIWIVSFSEFKKGSIIKYAGCPILFVTNLDKIKAGWVNYF